MKYSRDKVDVVLLIVMAISAAILLLLAARGYMKLVHLLNYFVLVSGVVLVLNALVRQAMPEYRRSEETIPSLLIGYLHRCKQLIWTGRMVVHVVNRCLSRLGSSLSVAAMASEADVTHM